MGSSLRFIIFGLLVLILITSLTAIAATNTVPATRLTDRTLPYNINHLKPSACAGWSLTALVTGSVTLTGTEGNDLILASSGSDTIDGLGGSDCILGGGGDDQIMGGEGNDACLGGPGTDSFIACEGESQ